MSFVPNYELTKPLLNNLSQIERYYGQLEGLRLPKSLQLNLEKRNLVQSAYVSNSIEGNPMSLPEVTNLILGERLPINRDEKEVHNYHQILTHLNELADQPLDVSLTTTLHGQAVKGVQDAIAGKIRNKRVVVGKYLDSEEGASLRVKHEPPYHTKQQIINSLKTLFDWVNTALNNTPVPLVAGIFHHHFVYIHPFVDGNGRTCRLLTALIFLKGRYKVNRYFLLDDYYDIDRFQYSDMLNSADSGDKTQWLEYFTDGVHYSLESALDKARKAVQTMNFENRLTAREEQLYNLMQSSAEMTSHVLAEEFEISRQQAHSLLNALVEKGFVEKRGSTKSSYYVLA